MSVGRIPRTMPPTPNPQRKTMLHPIAIAHTPFKEKFAIPRQPSLAPAACGIIELLPPFNDPLALEGLDQVSHVWLLFEFHAVGAQDHSLRVRPPRLGGNEKIGVFATRSTHRPNGIGLSVVKLDKIEGTKLYVSGVDLLDGTPIVDIKPYVPYVDAVASAYNRIAQTPPSCVQVSFSLDAQQQAQQHSQRLKQDVLALVEQCLAQDPKPAYQKPEPTRQYGVKLWDIDVRWRYLNATQIEVISLTAV